MDKNLLELKIRKAIKNLSSYDFVNFITIDTFGKIRPFEFEPRKHEGESFDDYFIVYGATYGWDCGTTIDSVNTNAQCDNPRILWRRSDV